MAAKFICANWGTEKTTCEFEGRYSCRNCLLVTYCGRSCQKSHWPHHKSECRSLLGKETWQPAWVLEDRAPAFIGDDAFNTFGRTKYLWGNVPALDVLKLGSNEGEGYAGPLRVLFAASGDLRSAVKTITELPRNYEHSLEVTINDRDFDIVARNLILLLVALVVEESDSAIDCIIHVWYSALVRESDLSLLQERIRPLIQDVCDKIRNRSAGTLQAKTWKFGNRSLRVVLEQSLWGHLLSFFTKPAGLTAEKAQEIRTANTLAHSRRDYRDRYMLCLSPAQRVAFNKFRHDGLLLPFGFPRHDFKEPNPTFFQTDDYWPMVDNSDPPHGWSMKEVSNTTSGPATADIYGKLFFYIRGILGSFVNRISDAKVSFQLLHLDASSLPEHLDQNSFSRIDVSNISDRAWLGIHRTLYHMVPLLQPPTQNPHATLVTLFMNAVDETMTDEDQLQGMTAQSRDTKTLIKYLAPSKPSTLGATASRYNPAIIKFQVGRELIRTYDHIFDRYSKNLEFHETEKAFDVEMKSKHTIVDKWPYRLKLRPNQPGAQAEFDRCMREGVSGKERYIEWKRTK